MPGRMELLARHPMIVVDGAHNPAGVRALVATLDGAFYVDGERRCVLGMLTGRDVDDMVEPSWRSASPSSTAARRARRARCPPREVAAAVRRLGAVAFEHPSAAAALAHARERSTDDDLIVVAGSLYLVAEVRGEVCTSRLATFVGTVRFLRRGKNTRHRQARRRRAGPRWRDRRSPRGQAAAPGRRGDAHDRPRDRRAPLRRARGASLLRRAWSPSSRAARRW